MSELPTDDVMRAMAKLAMEQAMQTMAEQADRMAASPLMLNFSGREALTAFAAAIRSTNMKVWPKTGSPA